MKQKIYTILLTSMVIIGAMLLILNTHAETVLKESTQEIVEDEMTFVNMTAELAKAENVDNKINKDTLEQQLEKYVGIGKTSVTKKSSDIFVIKFNETGNEYEIGTALKQEAFTIAYNISIGKLPSNTKYSYTSEDTVTLPTPTGTNYVFKGWYENSNFTGNAITVIDKGSTGNKTFYAKEHQHEGQSGQTTANGCYTKKEQYGGSCPGHVVSWECGYCGTIVQSEVQPSSCPNNVCGSNTGGQKWTANSTKTHKSADECDKWKWQYRYVLNCGW